MLTLSLCDDNAAEREQLKTLVLEWADRSGAGVSVLEYPSAEAFLFDYDDRRPDILLLDVEMPGESGVELAKKLRRSDRVLQIVFITAYSDYIAEGYEVAALHYLLKPADREKLFSVLDKAAERVRRDCRKITLETPDGTEVLPLYDVRYIESRKNYAVVHAEREYTVRRTLSDFLESLDGRFIKVGRSFIINLLWIRRVSRTEIELKSGEVIPIPRAAFDAVNRAIIDMK